MAEGSYEHGARVGLGVKMAHEAAVAMSATQPDPVNTYLGALAQLVDPTIALIFKAHEDNEAVVQPSGQAETAVPTVGGVQGVQQAFPGSQVEGAPAPPPAPPQQTYGPAQQPTAPQPAPIPNQSQGGGDWKAQQANERYQLFFQDTTAWEDCRFNKQNDRGPDFKHRSQKDQKGYKVAIWLKDAPEWAIPQLRQMGLVA